MNSTADPNPLVQIEFQIPFHKIQAGQVEPAVKQLLEDARERLDALASDPAGQLSFENTLLALDSATERLDYAMGVVRHLEAVATYPEMRAAYNAVQPDVSAFYSSIPLNERIWKVIKSYAATDEAQKLTGPRQRFLTKTMDTFRRHGAELDSAGKARLKEIDVELAKLTTAFSEHVLDTTKAFELVITDPSKLAGLPTAAIDAARQSAESKGLAGWRFTLQAPSYIALMTYLDEAAIRQQVYQAYQRRATGGDLDNRPLIGRILDLRLEKARLLGYRNFADLVLEDRMAGTGERAQRFVRELREKTEPFFHKENRDLQAFRRNLEGESAPELEPWDIAYYAEKLRAALYEFDEEALRPYFPLQSVVRGMFEIVGHLYGIRVSEDDSVPVWDPQVRWYRVHDSDGTFLGAFYADWYPRENKRGGAWMDAFITGGPAEDGFHPHLGVICGNLTPPVSEKPALLTHREVQTIFHEFGHLLHHILSRAEIRSQAGTNVAWDFVELPSQIMENWCWERQALDLFARHFESGQPIPEELFQKMKRAQTFRSANAQMRQLGFGTVDLALHIDYSPEADGDVMTYARRILQEFSPAPLPPDYSMLAAFTHLFANPVGYGSGYYSYKWAEVLDADAFTRFQHNGIFSEEVGREFRDRILSRGDTDDPGNLYRLFMGRDPDPAALLERAGLR